VLERSGEKLVQEAEDIYGDYRDDDSPRKSILDIGRVVGAVAVVARVVGHFRRRVARANFSAAIRAGLRHTGNALTERKTHLTLMS
jgi:hypothetical protein